MERPPRGCSAALAPRTVLVGTGLFGRATVKIASLFEAGFRGTCFYGASFALVFRGIGRYSAPSRLVFEQYRYPPIETTLF